MCNPAPIASTAGSFITSSTLWDQFQFYSASLTAYYIYNPAEDGWQQIPSSGLAGTFGAASCGTYHPLGPTGTASAGAASTLTTTLTIPGSLANYKIRLTGGTGAGQERTIASNTYGANSVLTVSSPWTVTPDATTTYVLITGRWWVFCGNNAATQGFRYYDVATNTWSAALSTTNIPVSFDGDGKLRSTPGGVSFATGTATAGAATTLTNSAKTWTTSQWTNHQVRLTAGTGAGQVRTIASNTGTVLTVSASWTITPDATSQYVIEGNDDFIYLAGDSAVTLYRYSISGNTWTVLSPGVARSGAPSTGMSLQWVSSESDALWANESAIINGRRLYSFRGGATGTLDYYDIPSNAWTSAVTYQRATETFTTGTSWENAGNGTFYVQKDATSRFFRYDVAAQTLDAFSTLPYPQSTALLGDRLFTVDFTSGSDSLKFLYHLRNNATEMFRCLVF